MVSKVENRNAVHEFASLFSLLLGFSSTYTGHTHLFLPLQYSLSPLELSYELSSFRDGVLAAQIVVSKPIRACAQNP